MKYSGYVITSQKLNEQLGENGKHHRTQALWIT